MFFGGEDGGVGAVENFAGVVAVEDSDGGAVDEILVGAVVDKDDALLSEDWRGAGFYDAGVKYSGAAGKDRSLRGFGPVEEIGGVGEAQMGTMAPDLVQPTFQLPL